MFSSRMIFKVMNEHEYQRSGGFAAKTVVCVEFIRIDLLYYLGGVHGERQMLHGHIAHLEDLFWRDLMNI